MLVQCCKQDMEEAGSWAQVVSEPHHPIVRKHGELRATEHTMMLREVAFINTQGSGPGPANNRGHDDGSHGCGGREGQEEPVNDNN